MCPNKKYRDSGALWRVMGWPSLASVIVNDSVTREAITRKQQRDLLKFIQEDKHFSRYYDAIYILFHTGLCISEFCGLTVSEIEFGEMRIKVDHQLQRTAQMQYVIEEPKTEKASAMCR